MFILLFSLVVLTHHGLNCQQNSKLQGKILYQGENIDLSSSRTSPGCGSFSRTIKACVDHVINMQFLKKRDVHGQPQ